MYRFTWAQNKWGPLVIVDDSTGIKMAMKHYQPYLMLEKKKKKKNGKILLHIQKSISCTEIPNSIV